MPTTLSRLNGSRAAEIAHGWSSFINNSDPGIVMYAFASTGRVQSEQHRADLLAYIDGMCRRAARSNIAAGEHLDSHDELDALRAHIATAPIEAI